MLRSQGNLSTPTLVRELHSDTTTSYAVLMVENLFAAGGPIFAHILSARSGLIVTTPNVASLYLHRFVRLMRSIGCDLPVLVLDCDENTKTSDQVLAICQKALECKLGRESCIVGFGGGVCSDIVTVAASWIRRGIGLVRVPTTLVGQIDAAIGIKGGLNFKGQKSYLGCFYPPRLVVIDPLLLASVPAAHLRSGMAEMLKIAIVRDARLFEILESYSGVLVSSGFTGPRRTVREVLWRSIVGMMEELEPNLYEDRTYERLVDFGHTFSPLLESASRFRMTHGEAVAVDMALSCVISSEVGGIGDAEAGRILAGIHAAGLPLFSPLLTQRLCEEALDHAVCHRGGMLNLVIPLRAGRATFVARKEEVPPALLGRAIKGLSALSRDLNEASRAGLTSRAGQ